MNPQTGQRELVQREEEKIHLEDADRIALSAEIVSGHVTAEEVRQKYGIVSINSVYTWVGKYLSQIKELSLQDKPESEEDMANKSRDDQIRELRAKLKQAEKKAEYEALRAHAYDKMIDLAEEKFNIPIRKKSGTKQ